MISKPIKRNESQIASRFFFIRISTALRAHVTGERTRRTIKVQEAEATKEFCEATYSIWQV